MKYFITFIYVIIALLVIAFLIVSYIKYSNNQKTSEQKLEELDKKFMADSSIVDGGVFIKSLDSGKEHRITKGDIHNKKFYLASVSKLFTHTLVFQLIDEGIIEKEKHIEDYLSRKVWKGILKIEGKDYSGKITIKDLLDQTSGLADYETDFQIDGKHILDALVETDFLMSFESALDATRTLNPIHKPGKNESAYYSNLNSLLLGKIAEELTGQSYADLIRERIVDKLDLKNTSVAKRTFDIVPVHVKSVPRSPIKYISSAPAAGGLVSDLEDTMTFIQAFFKGELFDKKHIVNGDFKPIQFFPIQYGSGMMKVEMNSLISPIIAAPRILGHSGSTGSFAYYHQDSDTFIVGTTNQVKSNPYMYIYSYLDALIKAESKGHAFSPSSHKNTLEASK